MFRISDLRVRDVIDVVDGKRLGFVEDLELDLEQGRVKALIVPGAPRLMGLFGRERDYLIPWEYVLKVGEDVILVEVPDPSAVSHRRGGRRLDRYER
ncbi:MAG: YlmC/YmxH family sporulation protein [Thermaerobacterales bacterium]